MPEHLEPVRVFGPATNEECRVQTLVLTAAGIEHHVLRDAGQFSIFVTADDARRARLEIEAYAQENVHEPHRTEAIEHAQGVSGVMAYASVLLLAGICAQHDLFGADWISAGKTHAESIRQGQWWRTVTALTLHSDLLHLMGNIAFGGLFGFFASQALGNGVAWFSILVGGAAGNFLNAWLRPPEHTSLGASTAVFAALGLAAAIAWSGRLRQRDSWLIRFAPLVGAVVLLSFLGTGGGPRTDVIAHLTGFFCGVLLGAAYGILGARLRTSEGLQQALAALTIGLLALAWALALLNSGRAAVT